MLNTVWSAEDSVNIKEELTEDSLSNPESPLYASSLCQPPSSPSYPGVCISDYHKLSPPDSSQHYYYASNSNQLQTLIPLPSFTNALPDSPSERIGLDYPTISISEIDSPDSSNTQSTNHNIDSTVCHLSKSRKRSNSGSSGSSAQSGSCGSGPSRPKVRRRQPLSQGELDKQRNDGIK